jgi:uncharacterized protein YggT (Ycf19 family)
LTSRAAHGAGLASDRRPASGTATSTSTAVAVARAARALTYLVYAFVVVAMVLLLGFSLLLFGANPDAPFAEWVYRSLTRVMAPFRGLFERVPLDDRSVVDVSILFAMIVCGVAALLLRALIDWLTDRVAETGYAR